MSLVEKVITVPRWKRVTADEAADLHKCGVVVYVWNLHGPGDVRTINEFLQEGDTSGWRYGEGTPLSNGQFVMHVEVE